MQENIGVLNTFDRIKNDVNHMTLGKWMIFCKTFHVMSDRLTRFVLMEKFKKIADGFH